MQLVLDESRRLLKILGYLCIHGASLLGSVLPGHRQEYETFQDFRRYLCIGFGLGLVYLVHWIWPDGDTCSKVNICYHLNLLNTRPKSDPYVYKELAYSVAVLGIFF